MSFPLLEVARPPYTISTDPQRLDLGAVHAYLARSYWSPGIPRATVERAIARSLCFGLYRDRQQVGFARVITDGATYAYLCDVYVLEDHRGSGLGKWLVATVLAHESLQGLRRITLATRDAHGLYEQLGFVPVARPQNFMEIHRPNLYTSAAPSPTPSETR